MNDRLDAFGNFGAWPNPPYVTSAICKRFTAASSRMDLSILFGIVTCSSLFKLFIKLSAAFSISDGFSFHD